MPAPGCRQRGAIFLSRPKGKREADRIGVHMLAKAGDFIDEGNLGGDEGRGRLARQFRGFVIRNQHGDAAHHQGMENLLEGGNRFARTRCRE